MITNMKTRLSGTAIAMAAAGLAGCVGTNTASSSTAAQTDTAELGHCYGVNSCKGHNDCKTADNACKGMGACKGKGFVAMPVKACKDAGGTVRDDWRAQIAKAELTQCFGVNVCKGHNDCKTANNACKGHSACKGAGFVMTTAKSCTDMGGTTR